MSVKAILLTGLALFIANVPAPAQSDSRTPASTAAMLNQTWSRGQATGKEPVKLRSFPLRLDSTAKLAQVLAQVEFYGLGFEYFSDYPKWIERVTKEDVQRVAKQYLDPKRYALVVVGNLAKAKVKN